LSQRIVYLSIDDFLKRNPDDQAVVLFDEIDEMIGQQSFNIVEMGDKVKGSYYPEVMKSWKSIVGLSGTLSNSAL
jgi:hypothetical protein